VSWGLQGCVNDKLFCVDEDGKQGIKLQRQNLDVFQNRASTRHKSSQSKEPWESQNGRLPR